MEKPLMFALLVILALGIVLGSQYYVLKNPAEADKDILKKFNSEAELEAFIKKGNTGYIYYSPTLRGGTVMDAGMMKTMETEAAMAPSGSDDFSKTNVQVEGVDEADIVKTDGKYIYTLSGNKMYIISAEPGNSKPISEIPLKGEAKEIFINEDKLVIFGSQYNEEVYSTDDVQSKGIASSEKMMILPRYPQRYSQYAYINVYDMTDRSNPKLSREIMLSGYYFSSRMIGKYVYAVINMPAYYYGGPIIRPLIKENGAEKTIPANDIYYHDYPDNSYNFVNILSINIQDDNEEYTTKTVLSPNTQNMYVSSNNIYTAFASYNYNVIYTPENIIENVIKPLLPATVANRISEIKNSNDTSKWEMIEKEITSYTNSLGNNERTELEERASKKMAEFELKMAKDMEKTIIHKVSISDGEIKYSGQGTVPGTILNQFSMDERDGYLRIATTRGQVWTREAEFPSTNNIYVLDSDLEIKGMIEDLAPGERIYSARFMGERAYMVTFKKVDPLFVIDLKDPENPKLLGKLKIPGYSDYLHPYDENHIIGIGKEAVEAEEGDFAWYQGIKLALFDVSDPENPKEISKYNVGDRGTDSYALHDHKAFLFSREKNLLAIPILLAEIDRSKYADGKLPPYAYGDFKWQGAYVFSIDPENGFKLTGRISHVEDDSLEKSGYYYYSPNSIKRSLYIGNTLYTVSDAMVKMNDLATLEELGKTSLGK
ncbi:beta-propeller domain-containing protein [Candidatus Woesearchaeota archaeon]|nr:beta-propeller domain-containing protein [Candidatus Woesearchaeota archaeon]